MFLEKIIAATITGSRWIPFVSFGAIYFLGKSLLGYRKLAG
jgi:hypothetical protein